MGEADGQFSPESSSAKGEDLSFYNVLDEFQALVETDIPNQPTVEQGKEASNQSGMTERGDKVETRLLHLIDTAVSQLESAVQYLAVNPPTDNPDKIIKTAMALGQMQQLEEDTFMLVESESWKNLEESKKREWVERIIKDTVAPLFNKLIS